MYSKVSTVNIDLPKIHLILRKSKEYYLELLIFETLILHLPRCGIGVFLCKVIKYVHPLCYIK